MKSYIVATIIITLLSSIFSCKNEEKEAWIKHTLMTIERGNYCLEQLKTMKELINKDESISSEDFEIYKKSKKGLEFTIMETVKMVADNPPQQVKLEQVRELLFFIELRDLEDFNKEKAAFIRPIEEMINIINEYIKVEEKLLEKRRSM